MRQELVRLGFRELRTADDVDTVLENVTDPLLVVVNSVCGCAAGAMRPGVALSLVAQENPPALATVFAGQDLEAT
jgi:putative YphP/YqiW family bacilliredoxin